MTRVFFPAPGEEAPWWARGGEAAARTATTGAWQGATVVLSPLSHCTGRYGWSPKNGWMAWMMMVDDGWDELNGLICGVWGGKQSPKISKDPTKKINTYRWNMMKLIPKDGKSTEMGLVSAFFGPWLLPSRVSGWVPHWIVNPAI